MRVKRPFEVLMHFILLMAAILSVKQTIEEFLEGSTLYSTTNEPLTLHDLPTLTICWKVDNQSFFWNNHLKYGKHVSIDIKIIETNSETITLLKDLYVQTSKGLGMHLSELYQRKTQDEIMPCYLLIQLDRKTMLQNNTHLARK